MNALFTFIVVVQVLSALTIIGLVLLQHGKGADMGAAFGSGASGSLFGASGSSNFLSRSTGVAAAIFFGATLALAFIGNQRGTTNAGVMENVPVVPAQNSSTPAAGAASKQGAPSAPGSDAAPNAAAKQPAAAGPGNAADQANQIPK
jgi:preprotein translocase subunit SecG